MSEILRPVDPLNVIAALEGLDYDINVITQLPAYLEDVERCHHGLEVLDVLSQTAQYPALRGLIEGEYDLPQSQMVTQTFYRGALLGMKAIELSPSAWVLASLESEKIIMPGTNRQIADESEIVRVWAQSVRMLADEGLALASEYGSRLDTWAALVTPDPFASMHFKQGFGFTLMIAKQAVDRRSSQEFETFMQEAGLGGEDWSVLEKEFETGE
jgi:hypothetical protein